MNANPSSVASISGQSHSELSTQSDSEHTFFEGRTFFKSAYNFLFNGANSSAAGLRCNHDQDGDGLKILVVNGNPKAESYGKSLAETYTQAARSAGAVVTKN
ncbi:MAG: hypothetical protein P8176_15735 [Gammaproteobacteria bacterium]